MSENSEDCVYETIYFDILAFLAEYEKLPCLWDKYHEFFKDRKERLKCEEILGEKLGIHDLRTLRRKIRSVRGTYNTEIRKLKYSIDNGVEVFPPRLFWFPTADKFLRVTTDLPYDVFPLCEEQNIKSRNTVSKSTKRKGVKQLMIATPKKQKAQEDQIEYILENNSDENQDDYEEYEELEMLEDDGEVNQNCDMSVRFETDEFDQSEHIESASSISRVKKNATSHNNFNEILNSLKDIATDNEFIAFGRSVGVQLKNMPLDIAVQLQMEIQSHITKTRLEYLQRAQRQMENTDVRNDSDRVDDGASTPR